MRTQFAWARTVVLLLLSVSTARTLDLDHDGLDDLWELLHPAVGPASADSDGDGPTNAQESLAGTDPLVPGSRLAVQAIAPATGGFTVSFPTVLGKRYRIERTTSLLSPNWDPVGAWFNGDGNLSQKLLPFDLPADARYYHIAVDDLDSDGDGVSDWDEIQVGYNPNAAQTNPPASDLSAISARLQASGTTVSITAANPTANETGLTPGAFTIQRTGRWNALTIPYTLTGTATAGEDYNALSGSVSLPVGVDSATLVIQPRADLDVEGNETVVATIGAGADYTLGTSQATVTIADAPTPPPGARTFFVREDGNDATAGTSRANAFKTIQRAANAVVAGDTVIVMPGVYSESVQLTTAGTASSPITFKTDAVARGRVIISGANRAIRDGSVGWTAETSYGQPGLYSIAMIDIPLRVVVDDVDLYRMKSFQEFLEQRVGNIPGPLGGWFPQNGRVYVRIHPSGQNGSTDPAAHVMKLSPPMAGGETGNVVAKPADYNFGALSSGPSYVVLDGFTFETPSLGGVYAPNGNVTVRNCWSVGCHTMVSGTALADFNDACANVVIEYCDHAERGVMQDIRDVITLASALPAAQQSALGALFWWHRKGGPLTYETGIAVGIGTNWAVRHCYVHDTFDALSVQSVASSRNLEVASNVFGFLTDNAVELEEHSQGMRVHDNYVRDVWEPFSWQPNQAWPVLPDDAEFHHNVVEMRTRMAEFWLQPSLLVQPQQSAGIFKLVAPFTYVTLVQGLRFHHNTLWHPHGPVIDAFNLGSLIAGISFSDNLVVSPSMSVRQPNPAFQYYQFSHNIVAPSVAGAAGPTAQFAGSGGSAVANVAALRFVDPYNGDFRLQSSSPAVHGSTTGGAVGAIEFGTVWAPPEAGPQVTPLAQITPTGAVPVAVTDNAVVARLGRVQIFPLANDTDADRNLLTLQRTGTASHGQVEREDQTIWYTPDVTFTSTDAFTYTIGDGRGHEVTGTVNITRINAAPKAQDDTIQANSGATVNIPVLANDTDADGDLLTVQSFTQPMWGTVTLQGQNLRYAPAATRTGTDTFTYTVSDGQGGTATAAVLLVSLTNPPIARPDSVNFTWNQPAIYSSIPSNFVAVTALANDDDGNGGSTPITLVSATNGSKGGVDIRPPNAQLPDQVHSFPRYEPYPGTTGLDTYTYTISNLSGQTATATVTVRINNKPTLVNDTASATKNVAKTINVLANDSDLEGDPLTIKLVGTPSLGSVSIVNNQLRYTATSTGTDTFTYTVDDGKGFTSIATVTVTVTP